MQLLTERHSGQIAGALSCYDRILVQGTLPTFCYAQGMTAYLYTQGNRIFDYPRFAQPLRDQLQVNAERLASENGLSVEYIRNVNFRKEDRVRARLRERGTHPGLICIFSALERCCTYQPWHDKKTGKAFLRPHDGKCLHYYFYFLDEDLGLVFVRVPTWCPFRSQQRSYPGFNFFAPHDLQLFETLVRGEFNLRGFHNKDLRPHLPAKNSGQVSRLLKRLRLHGLIKIVSQNHKYYLTSFGKQILTAGLKLRNLVLIPQLALPASSP